MQFPPPMKKLLAVLAVAMHVVFARATMFAVVTTAELKGFTVLNAVSGSPGVTRSFNNHGRLVWRATFADGSNAIVVTQVP